MPTSSALAPEVTIDAVKAKAQSPGFVALNKRYVVDQGLYYLNDFVMQDKNKEPMPNVMNVTTNDPGTLADRCVATLQTAKSRMEIIGEIEKSQSSELEKYHKQTFNNNDETLSWKYIEPLKFSVNWYDCVRGSSIVRTLFYYDSITGDMLPEFMPIDPWNSYWDVDKAGLKWGSYELLYSKSDCLELFDIKIEGDSSLATEIWTRNQWIVYAGEKKKPFVFDHNFGEVPLTIVPVQGKPWTNDGTGVSSQGESIYRLNRKLYPILNDLVSVWATSHKAEIMGPLAFVSPTGRKLKGRPYGLGIIVNLQKGEQFVPIPVKEIGQSGQALFGQYSAWLQRGGLSNTEYGEASFDYSAVALAKLGEAKDQIFNPRLDALAAQYRGAMRHLRLQYMKGGFKQDRLSDRERELCMTVPGDLIAKKVFVGVTFHAVYPEQNIANIAVAQAQTTWYSDETILEKTFKEEDVPGEIRKKLRESARRELPTFRHLEYALNLAPERTLSEAERDSLLAAAVWYEIEKETGGAIQAPKALAGQTAQLKEKPSQPRPGLTGPRLPQIPELHSNNLESKRKGISQSKQGQQEIENARQ
jgi:hypothetical protein